VLSTGGIPVLIDLVFLAGGLAGFALAAIAVGAAERV
jgi:hypothetical protein